jgi:uncharacterized protein YkwD
MITEPNPLFRRYSVLAGLAVSHLCLTSSLSAVPALYSIGTMTDDEQLVVELINRARANPQAEVQRLLNYATVGHPTMISDVVYAFEDFSVDRTALVSQFAGIPALPPVAPNAQLNTAARAHSQWMLSEARQEHDQTLIANDGVGGIADRILATGYPAAFVGENIYAYGFGTYYSHAGFEVDWGLASEGPVVGGMQSPPGHRNNIHSTIFREVGSGVVFGSNSKADRDVGPQLGTQEYGLRQSAVPLVTGVCYHDLNGNAFYDVGEGIGGLTISVDDANFYTVTSNAGGYSLPLLSGQNRAYTMRITGLGAAAVIPFSVSNLANVKVDYRPSTAQANLTSNAGHIIGIPNTLRWNTVVGADQYTVLRATTAATVNNSCDSLTNVTPSIASGYTTPVLQGNVRVSGQAWHLAHIPTTGSNEALWQQKITLDTRFLVGAGGAVGFSSRLRGATDQQTASLQISENEGDSWKNVWSQTGKGGAGEANFSVESASLAAYIGRTVRVRFLYNFSGYGSYVNSTDDISGWFIDNVTFTGLQALTGVTETYASTPQLTVTPATAGTVVYAVRPLVNDRSTGYQFGSFTSITASPATEQTAWALEIEAAAELPLGSIASYPAGDYDGDGVPNSIEYMTGASPIARTQPPLSQPTRSGNQMSFTYPRSTTATGLTLAVQGSVNFRDWYTRGQSGAPFTWIETPGATVGGIQSQIVTLTLTGQPVYLRLRAQ